MNVKAENIIRLRKEIGLTKQEMSKRIGLSVKTLYRYEKDLVKRYTESTVKKLTSFYDVDEFDIWEEDKCEKK